MIRVIEKHTKAILRAFQLQLQRGIAYTVFSTPGVVSLVKTGTSPRLVLSSIFLHGSTLIKSIIIGDTYTLQTHLVADEMALTTIDARTGRINLRDTGDPAAAGRGPRFIVISERLNENPPMLLEALVRLRLHVSILVLFLFSFFLFFWGGGDALIRVLLIMCPWVVDDYGAC